VSIKPKTILLVEDNSSDIELTRRALQKVRIANQLVVAEDGVDALDYLFRAGSDLPALVLLDLKLPRLSGLDVLRRIRAEDNLRYLPVVIFTTSSEESDIIKSYDLGANSYILKPVDFMQFMIAIDTLGLYWLILNEIVPGKDDLWQTP
jgi:CheY-like chemotaxis protein